MRLKENVSLAQNSEAEGNGVNSTIQGRRPGACFSKVTIINWPEMLLLFDTKCDDEF